MAGVKGPHQDTLSRKQEFHSHSLEERSQFQGPTPLQRLAAVGGLQRGPLEESFPRAAWGVEGGVVSSVDVRCLFRGVGVEGRSGLVTRDSKVGGRGKSGSLATGKPKGAF